MALEVHGLIMIVKAIKIAFSKKNNWIFEYGKKTHFGMQERVIEFYFLYQFHLN